MTESVGLSADVCVLARRNFPLFLIRAIPDAELLIMVALPWVMSPLLAHRCVLTGLDRAPAPRKGLVMTLRWLSGLLKRCHVGGAED